MRILLHWLVSAASLLVVANVVNGIQVDSFVTALMAALVYGLVSVTIGFLLKLISIPLIFVTLGVFYFVINALMLQLASALVPGFRVRGFFAAFVGALLLSIVQGLLSWLLKL